MRYYLLLACLCANILLAQSPITQQLPVPFSTDLLSVDLAANGQGYATGTCGFMLETSDGGDNWSIVNGPTNDEDLIKLRCRPGTDCQQIFAASTTTLYRSLNGGNTWSATPIPGNGSILDIVFPGNSQALIISRNVTTLTFSNDNGATLEQRSMGFAPATTLQFVDPQRGFFFSNQRKLVATEDGGVTWAERYEHTTGIRKMSFLDELTGFMYNADGIVFKTTDGGINWTEVGAYPDVRFLTTELEAISETTLELYTTRGIHRSTDGGVTFSQVVNINSLNSRFEDISLSEILRIGTEYWLSGSNSGMLYSDDDFSTITHQIGGERPAFRDVAISGDKVFAITFQDGLFRSDDGGATYGMVPNESFISGTYINTTTNGSVVISGNGSPKISTDDGASFSDLLPASVPDQLYRTVNILANGRIVAAGEEGASVYSDNNGANWTLGTSHGLTGTMLNISSAGQVVGINTRENFAVSLDGGETWSSQSLPENVGVQPLFFVVDANNWLVARIPSGRLTHTADAGATWTDINASAFSIVPDGNGRFYGLNDEQIIFSESLGARWEPATDVFCSPIGLDRGNITYDADKEVLIAGTHGHRIFSVDVSGLVSSTRTAVRSQPLHAFPNPTSGLINFTLPSAQGSMVVDVQVVSATGQVVQQRQLPVAPVIGLDLSDQPVGMYLVRVTGEGWASVGRVVLSR